MFKLKPQADSSITDNQKIFEPKTKLMMKLELIDDNISEEIIKNSF